MAATMLPCYRHSVLVNPTSVPRGNPFNPEQEAVLAKKEFEVAQSTLKSWPGYAPTPLLQLPGVAAALGVKEILWKDESGRFGQGSFKSLGGAYGVSCLLMDEVEKITGKRPTLQELLSGDYKDVTGAVTIACATDGNHGRGVAWASKTCGCQCVVYVPEAVSSERRDAIRSLGAEVVEVLGTYDDALAKVDAKVASTVGWRSLADTGDDGDLGPKRVMQAYTLIAKEIGSQMEQEVPPTHIFLQAGVGGMAAAVAAFFCIVWGERRPKVVIVEPENAACVMESIKAGKVTKVAGSLSTAMGCLSCAQPSTVAWPVLKAVTHACVVIPDSAAARALRLLAAFEKSPTVGTSGVCGLAGIVATARHPYSRHLLGIDSTSRVLCIGTEGLVDPQVQAQLLLQSQL